jgi:phosphoribosylformylglycinamidine synthase II
VGGILRDVFTMGARPIAAMNALSFGEKDHPKTRSLVHGVVEGIGGYGNCFGVPTIGGETRFHPAYNGNCLVNAFAAGPGGGGQIFYSAASGVGMPVVYLGAKTGRDGVGGATMASAEFDDTIEEKRPTVQVGDPFTEKRLLEACLELMATGAVISIQDMGAAGLTCSAVEMGDKGGLGIQLTLDHVPQREDAMTAYEMMLSESQERMLMVLRPEKEAEARAVFEKWDLDFAIVGETIPEDRFVIVHGNETVADLPLSKLSSEAPEYDRPWVEPPRPRDGRRAGGRPHRRAEGADRLAELLLARVDLRTIRLHQVMADTIRTPARRGHRARARHRQGAGLHLRRHAALRARQPGRRRQAGGGRGLPQPLRRGGEAAGHHRQPQFRQPREARDHGPVRGRDQRHRRGLAALDMPIVSGNVSLYNETDGQAILPTPTIGAVGLLDVLDR